MTTLPVGRLAALLTASAKGYYATEAATALLIAHGVWLRRGDFIAACVEFSDVAGEPIRYDPHSTGSVDGHPTLVLTPSDPHATVAYARVLWDQLPSFAEGAACSGSEDRILRLVAELAGHDTGVPLDELLLGLDATNSASVLDAIAHALHHLPDAPAEDVPTGAAGAVSDADIDLLTGAIADPGRYTPRGDGHTEPVPHWSARAVLAALEGRDTDR
jgi:hypothetical protein